MLKPALRLFEYVKPDDLTCGGTALSWLVGKGDRLYVGLCSHKAKSLLAGLLTATKEPSQNPVGGGSTNLHIV